MPIKLTKKKDAGSSIITKTLDEVFGRETTTTTAGLDTSNRTARTPVGWIMDGSPSMTGFTQLQLDSASSMVADLRKVNSTSRSVLMNIIQLGTPPLGTGFQEIARFQAPHLHPTMSTPIHTALEMMTRDLGSLCSDLRGSGIERTDSVVVITTDGEANGATPEVLDKCVRDFLAIGKKWSVTNIVVGVGK
jgi:uncharacterized protein YegL